ncbi:MAG TPA: DinB family protein [Gemmatimonadaceae bacterium]|nr:DinB family protein [Gemmatimonadaceae bacterium]
MTDFFQKLAAHLKWADERVQESLVAARNPPPHTLDLMAHLVATEHVWLARIRGETPGLPAWPQLSLSQCAEMAAGSADEFSALIESLDEIALDGGITYRNSLGDEYTNSVTDILIHVALHGAYHRGQIAAALRAGGDTPATTDYIAMVRGKPAATRTATKA